MKHYPHHISDFNNATRHLSRIERSLYRDLIELYYETEKPLPLDVQALCRRIVANECSTDVERLLNEFFTQTPVGWYHERCEEEISKYQSNNSQRAQAGKASAAKKALKKHQALNGESTGVEIPLNDASTKKQNQSTNQPINQIQPTVVKRASKKCPDDFEVTADMQAWVASECPGVNVERASAKFRDHTFDKPKTDWLGTWKNWIRRDFDSIAAQSKLPAWREQQRSETLKAVPSIALGGVNPTTFFENLGAKNVAIARIR